MKFVSTYSHRNEILQELGNTQYSPARLVQIVSKALGTDELLTRQATREGYSVGEHTIIFLQQLEKYFPTGLPGLTQSASRILGVIHDICKRSSADGREQHYHTLQLLNDRGERLPLTELELQIIKALILIDSVGGFLQSISYNAVPNSVLPGLVQKHYECSLTGKEVRQYAESKMLRDEKTCARALTRAHKDILTQSGYCGMGPTDFLNLIAAYTAVDISCYTIDAERDSNNTFPNRELDIPDDEYDVPFFVMPAGRMCRSFERIVRPIRCSPSLEGVLKYDDAIDQFDLHGRSDEPLFKLSSDRSRLLFNPILERWFEKLVSRVSLDTTWSVPLHHESLWSEIDVGDFGEGALADHYMSRHERFVKTLQRLGGFDATLVQENIVRRVCAEVNELYTETPAHIFRTINQLLDSTTSHFSDDIDWGRLVEWVLPEFRSKDGPVRIACIGCSTGEEALSVAYAFSVTNSDQEFQVVGVDCNDAVLTEAITRQRSAVYWNGVRPIIQAGFHSKTGMQVSKHPDVGKLYAKIEFAYMNAVHESIGDPYDLIICAGLNRTYTEEGMRRIITNLKSHLNQHGYLFVSGYPMIINDTDSLSAG